MFQVLKIIVEGKSFIQQILQIHACFSFTFLQNSFPNVQTIHALLVRPFGFYFFSEQF